MRNFSLGVSILAASFLVASCGGGDKDDGSPASPSVVPLKAASFSESPALFSWAESAHPQYFSGPSQDGVYDVYSYRYFPYTENYIGLADGRVYVRGSLSGGKLMSVGRDLDFACSVRPTDCAPQLPISPVQAKWEAIARNPNGLTLVVRAYPRLYMVRQAMLDSPRSQPNGRSKLEVMDVHTFTSIGGVSVSISLPDCSAQLFGNRVTFDTSVILDDTGEPTKTCVLVSYEVQYVGGDVYLRFPDLNGKSATTDQITNIVEVDLAGVNVAADLRIDSWSEIPPNSAVFPAGAKKFTFWGTRFHSYVVFRKDGEGEGSLTPKVSAGQTGPEYVYAKTIEEVFLRPAESGGSIRTISGRRVWIKNGETPYARDALVEWNGGVYSAFYFPNFNQPVERFSMYNDAARNAMLAAEIKLIRPLAPARATSE